LHRRHREWRGRPGALLFSNPTPQAVTGRHDLGHRSPTSTFVPRRPPSSPAWSRPRGSSAGGCINGGLERGGVGVSQSRPGPWIERRALRVDHRNHWYFADASTAQGDTLLCRCSIRPTPRRLDVSFVSSHGVLAPPAYQGIEVPGDSMAVENVGSTSRTTRHRHCVSTSRERWWPPNSSRPAKRETVGRRIVLGATTPTSTWSFAQKHDAPTGQTVFHVFNPNRRPVRVTVKIGLEQGAAEPLVMRIPPSSVASLDAQSVTRIPSGSTFAVTFISGPGAGIVVDRHVSSPAGAVAPATGRHDGSAGEATGGCCRPPTHRHECVDIGRRESAPDSGHGQAVEALRRSARDGGPVSDAGGFDRACR